MSTESEDLVERLEDVRCDREPFTPDHAKCICRLANEAAEEITRLRAALAAERVKVKPLEWEGDGHWVKGDDEGWDEEAITPFGCGYSIEFGRYGEGDFIVNTTFDTRLTGFDTLDEAKAAAQADYERRIMAALEDAPLADAIRASE